MCGLRRFSNLILIFMSEGTLTVSSIVAITISTQTSVEEGSPVCTPSPALTVSRVFGNGHSDQCDGLPCCSLDLHFSNV